MSVTVRYYGVKNERCKAVGDPPERRGPPFVIRFLWAAACGRATELRRDVDAVNYTRDIIAKDSAFGPEEALRVKQLACVSKPLPGGLWCGESGVMWISRNRGEQTDQIVTSARFEGGAWI